MYPFSLCIAYTLFLFANSFEAFAIAQIFLAGGIAFNSGTDTSFLLESTQALNEPDTYPQLEAKAVKYGFLGTAAAGILGGLAAIPDYRGAYALSLAGGIGLLLITIRFTEPSRTRDANRVGFFT